MTLLESVVAFVILALVGIACLDLSRGAAQLERSSVEWSRAVALGEAALAAASVDAPMMVASGVVVQRAPWRDGVDRVDVAVNLSAGRVFRITRLVLNRDVQTRAAVNGAAR